MFRRSCLGGLAVLVALALPGTAHAQNADAEALFNEADAAERAGKLAEACDAFEASNRIEPRAGTMIRLGACREAQGRLASAWSAYKDALTRVKDARKRAVAEERVAALEPRLSYLIVSVPDESRVDGLALLRNGATLDPGLWNRATPVDGGTYIIEGKAPGHETWRTTVEVDAELDRAAVEVPRFKVLRTLAVPASGAAAATDATLDGRAGFDDARGGRLSMRRKVAIGAGAVGVAALVAGGLLVTQGQNLEADAYARCPDPAVPCADALEAERLIDQARARTMAGDIALGAGALAVGTAAFLWITGGGERGTVVSVVPRAGVRALALDVTWRF